MLHARSCSLHVTPRNHRQLVQMFLMNFLPLSSSYKFVNYLTTKVNNSYFTAPTRSMPDSGIKRPNVGARYTSGRTEETRGQSRPGQSVWPMLARYSRALPLHRNRLCEPHSTAASQHGIADRNVIATSVNAGGSQTGHSEPSSLWSRHG
jgi:hypothetical protein